MELSEKNTPINYVQRAISKPPCTNDAEELVIELLMESTVDKIE